MKLNPEERETIISFSDADNAASVYTYDKRLIKKLDALCKEYLGEVYVKRKPECVGHFYILPKRCISIRAPFSKAHREKLGEAAKNSERIPPNRLKHE